MARCRYVITEANKPHFLTCTVVAWLPLFTRQACVELVLNSWQHRHGMRRLNSYDAGEKLNNIHNNPVKRGYVERPEHWRYSSAKNYLGEAGLIEFDDWS